MRRVPVAFAVAACWVLCLLTPAGAEDSLPQNGRIAFSSLYSSEQGESYDIYTVDPDGSSLSKLSHRGATATIPPAWSPDGTKIAFGSQDSIWVMDAYGSNPRRLTPIRSDVSYSNPTWSPDGTELAFTGFVEPETSLRDIYTMDVDGSDITNITRSPKVDETGIDFSPDGSQMCLNLHSEDPPLKYMGEMYVMNIDGSNLTRLTEEGNTECAWSPDGTKIAYEHLLGSIDAASSDVYVMNADGSGKTNLTRNKEDGFNPAWSPDGTRITFSSTRDSGQGFMGTTYGDIYTMDADGSDVVQVTKTPLEVSETEPDWQPLPGTTVDQPDTGGPSLLWVAGALLFSGGVMFYAAARRAV